MSSTINILNQNIDINIESLNLQGSSIKNNIQLENLKLLPSLRHLNMTWSNLNDDGFQIISSLTNLEILDLDGTEISNNGLIHLTKLKKLKELRLKDNPQIEDKAINYIAQLEQLALLHIGNTSITINGLKRLQNLRNIETIILGSKDEQRLPTEQVFLFSKSLPNCEIIFQGTGIRNGSLEG